MEFLLGIYILSALFFWIECYFDHIAELGEGDGWWQIIVLALMPILNTLITLVYLSELIFRNEQVEEGGLGLKRRMHKIQTCCNCGINSYKGRVIQNRHKCPFCDSSSLRDRKNEDAPLSVKMNFWECVLIARKATKINLDFIKGKHKYATEEFKKAQAIQQAKEEYAKAEFKDKQLELYLALQQKQLDKLVEERQNVQQSI